MATRSERFRRRTYATWAALERYDLPRDAQGYREPALPAEPGTVHAFRQGVPADSREPEFFDARGPFALCGRHVKVRLAVEFSADDEAVCEQCAALVRSGQVHRRGPSYDCGAIVRPDMDGFPGVIDCQRPDGHDGPHSGGGGTWQFGPDDFTPSGDYSTGSD